MRETLETLLALEGFFSRMKSLVFGQVMLVFECFTANITLVWTLTCNERFSR